MLRTDVSKRKLAIQKYTFKDSSERKTLFDLNIINNCFGFICATAKHIYYKGIKYAIIVFNISMEFISKFLNSKISIKKVFHR